MTSITLATTEDLRDAAEIFAECFPADGDRSAQELRLREEHERRMARITVAKDDEGRLVGVLLSWHVADEVTLLDVGVRATRQKEGHGRALVTELLDWARESSGRLVMLEVRGSNTTACRLYKSLGFEPVGVRRRYYPDGEDAIEMHVTLAPV